jgi:predicted hotdog family 3-hydroxylacyl-ACP dehydratase
MMPALRELLPQRGAMRLLSHALEHSEARTRCALDPAASALFARPEGSIPAFVALEWMAQCAAAHGALRAHAQGERPPAGLLLRARDVRLRAACFRPGETLLVEARAAGASGALLRFECEVWREGEREPLASGLLSVQVRGNLPSLGHEGSA